ncbi:hypothetical protein RFI_15031 [Reticulomyxa filosa]|uniref:Uncharacterized protein n=1 Tax=Reticulomyxa filosa TaxID=46433 RepID=X6N7A4_RETFI|nr:hypothetical protein RFI_15031 [Reticulomyxa filosa]|eukprot:ETO22170.1 hypothetical protein RFI_15031 [Reticulomyxa filosa]
MNKTKIANTKQKRNATDHKKAGKGHATPSSINKVNNRFTLIIQPIKTHPTKKKIKVDVRMVNPSKEDDGYLEMEKASPPSQCFVCNRIDNKKKCSQQHDEWKCWRYNEQSNQWEFDHCVVQIPSLLQQGNVDTLPFSLCENSACNNKAMSIVETKKVEQRQKKQRKRKLSEMLKTDEKKTCVLRNENEKNDDSGSDDENEDVVTEYPYRFQFDFEEKTNGVVHSFGIDALNINDAWAKFSKQYQISLQATNLLPLKLVKICVLKDFSIQSIFFCPNK